MAAILNEYELSIWKDVWAQPTLFDDDGNVTQVLNGNKVLDEEKSAILSMDNFTFPGKATNIIFKTKINGTHELTFDLPGKYIDPTTGKKVKNYLRELTDNETKIKLNYKDEWYTFYVKKVTEKRDKNITTFSYSCEDSFISELSKIGYKITFNEYTEHYIEDIHTFAEDILDGSEWHYDRGKTNDNCDLIEYQEEKLVPYVTTSEVDVRRLIGSYGNRLYETETGLTIPSGTVVYGFYSEDGIDVVDKYNHGSSIISSRSDKLIKQIIYVPDENYEYSGNTICNKNCNYIIDASKIIKDNGTIVNSTHKNYLKYGLKICYNQYTVYSKPLDRYVKVYIDNSKNTDVPALYSFTKTRILVPEIATDYAANGRDMIDTTGWAPEMAIDKLKVEKLDSGNWVTQNGVPSLAIDNGTKTPHTYGIVASKLTSKNGQVCKIINTGPYSRKLTIDTPTTFALRLDYFWSNPQETTMVSNTTNSELLLSTSRGDPVTGPVPTISICRPVVSGIGDSYYKEIVTESSAKDDDGNYEFASPLYSVNVTQDRGYYIVKFDNNMLANGPITDLFIVISFDATTNQELDFCIENLEFFEAWTHEGKHTSGTFVPDEDVVPPWEDWHPSGMGTGRYNWMKQYISSLNDGNTSNGIYSASYAYDKMMEGLASWESQHQGGNTLVTSRSIVSGKAFDEEIYFYEPEYQPQFADPYVNFVNPEDTNIIVENAHLEQLYNNFKYRTLKQEKSNRFNLTQQLSELFHVYPVYEINYYPNGKIKKNLYDENGYEITNDNYLDRNVAYFKRDKSLYYTDQKGGENKYGFKYGHNLNSISRNVDSTNIVSKMFVPDNLNQYAKDGICTISRAKDNLGKDNYILRFDYFVNRNKVSREQIDEDLYGTEQDGNKKYTWSIFRSLGSRTISNGIGQTANPYYDPDDKYYKTLRNCEAYNFDDVIVYKGFLKTIGIINSRYDKLSADQALLEKHQLIVLEASVQTYTSAVKQLREQLSKQKNLTAAYAQERTNKKQAEYAESCLRIESKIETYEIMLAAAQSMYETYADLYNRYECEMQFLLWSKKKIEDTFNTRYEALIKEGVWQDSKYLEDNSYYLDAEKVSYDSCGPKITYTLSVTDLSALKKYQFADFRVGDVTYVEDYEFFEDDEDSNEKYYTERTIVSAITCNLDNPSKNTISLQNYSTKFDDLFSRITASVQSLTFNENIYQRAAKFTPSGRIDENTIQDTLNENDLTLVGNQDVLIDGNGILVTDLRIPSNKVKIVGSGVFLTADGGNSWYGAFENGGINASLLTVGAINTKSISIFNEGYSNFVWDKDGITAYGQSTVVNDKTTTGGQSKTNGHTYVRFNQYGLFFVEGSDVFDESMEALQEKAAGKISNEIKSYVLENASVAITYDGFSINGAGRKVRFTSAEGIQMFDEAGSVKVKLGYITNDMLPSDVKPFWGLYAQGAYIEGRLYSEKAINRSINFGGTGSTNSVKVFDRSRSMLYGGKLQICRTIVERKDNTDAYDSKVKAVTSYGSSLMKGNGDTASEKGEEGGTQNSLDNVGSNIYIEKEGKFWSVSSYDNGEYKVKLVYAREAVANYDQDTFHIRCYCKAKYGIQNDSDIKLKKNIQVLDNRYIDMFDMLQPKTYNFKTENDGTPLHIGLIAQEVIEARDKAGLTSKDLGAVSHTTTDTLGITYSEILTIAIAKIKQLEERIKQLENK